MQKEKKGRKRRIWVGVDNITENEEELLNFALMCNMQRCSPRFIVLVIFHFTIFLKNFPVIIKSKLVFNKVRKVEKRKKNILDINSFYNMVNSSHWCGQIAISLPYQARAKLLLEALKRKPFSGCIMCCTLPTVRYSTDIVKTENAHGNWSSFISPSVSYIWFWELSSQKY